MKNNSENKIEIKTIYQIQKEKINDSCIQIFTPNTPSDEAIKLIKAIGLEAYNSVIALEHIKHECNILENYKKYHLNFQLIKFFLTALDTKDPHYIHFEIVRSVINEENSNLLDNNHLIAELACELIKYCKILKVKLIQNTPEEFNKIFISFKKKCDQISNDNTNPALEILTLSPDFMYIDSSFIKSKMFIWDKILLDIIKQTGSEGKRLSQQGIKPCKDRLNDFNNSSINPLNFWFNCKNASEPFHQSNALKFLTKAIFIDIIKPRLQKKEDNVPAHTSNVHHELNIIQSPKNKAQKTDEQIQLLTPDGSLIGHYFTTATLDTKIIDYVFKGVRKLNSVLGHKAIRYLSKKAYEQWINKINPYNTLSFDRAYTQIAEELELKSNKAPTELKELFHAMALVYFDLKSFSGNLMVLENYKSNNLRNQKPGLKIILGSQLCPNYIYTDGGLLIPVTIDPPLLNPQQYHAAQYLLQNEIMGEFSRQSIQVAESGFAIITKDMFIQKGLQSGLKNDKKIIEKIHDRWTQDGDDAPKFIEKIDKDCYILGPEYHKEYKFLQEQGKLRKRQVVRRNSKN